MPNDNDHVFKFKHNKKIYDEINSKLNDFIDWQIITLFYSALHMVEAEAYKRLQTHNFGHIARLRFVHSWLRPISGDFTLLYNESRIVRYNDCSDCSNKKNDLINYLLPAYNNIKSTLGY